MYELCTFSQIQSHLFFIQLTCRHNVTNTQTSDFATYAHTHTHTHTHTHANTHARTGNKGTKGSRDNMVNKGNRGDVSNGGSMVNNGNSA